MKLKELDARLLWQVEFYGAFRFDPPPPSLEEAQGISFLCPKCFKENNGPIGTHSVICWFAGRVSDKLDPGPGRWTPVGTGVDDISFVPGDPPRSISVKLTGGCEWHGFVVNGEAN